MPEPEFLPTTPGTRMEWSVTMRTGPCWRCRLHLRWPPWRKHWQCRKPVKIERYLDA